MFHNLLKDKLNLKSFNQKSFFIQYLAYLQIKFTTDIIFFKNISDVFRIPICWCM